MSMPVDLEICLQVSAGSSELATASHTRHLIKATVSGGGGGHPRVSVNFTPGTSLSETSPSRHTRARCEGV